MISLIRMMKVQEIVAAQGWMAQHKLSCPYGGRFEYDHESAAAREGKAFYRGIKVTVVCKCGATKELGVA